MKKILEMRYVALKLYELHPTKSKKIRNAIDTAFDTVMADFFSVANEILQMSFDDEEVQSTNT